MRLVLLSDTHCRHREIKLPEGDVLIHAGDFTIAGEEWEITDFNDWLGSLPYKHKVIVAGNHELLLENVPEVAPKLLTNCHYLLDSEVTIDGIRIWGAPWTPPFFQWAFMLGEREIEAKWNLIPRGIDVLVTHGPPRNIGDFVPFVGRGYGRGDGKHVGCPALLRAIERVEPQLHVFGHIHASYGKSGVGRTKFVNAAICDEAYRASNAPIVVDLKSQKG